MTALYCFGRFVLNPAERRLYADGVAQPLGSTEFGLLWALVESDGAVVAKEDLVSRVWRHHAVSDNALYVRINAIRKIIGDDCIVNKQGCGYRFSAQVQRAQRLPARPPESRCRAGGDFDRLIGRSGQLRVVSKLLARNRLVTLTGPGGVGKTRLALHAAKKSAATFPDGTWLVELASVSDPQTVPAAVAAALGIEIGDRAEPLDAVLRHLARKSLLLVLDNCEHVLAAAAVLSEAAIGAAPHVKVLATSREALCCSGERVLDVPPLALPPGETAAPQDIRRSPAIELFVERATNASASFRLTDRGAPVAARICSRVDGLPLAIEMVAGWAGALGLDALDAKLEGSIQDWLRAGTTAPRRHSTLGATLQWSHDLLSSAEQATLRRLAVFPGAFGLDAAEAVAGDADVPSHRIFEHLANLIRKSMVAVVSGPGAQGYRLLETTRAFMRDKLTASCDLEATRRRHARFVQHALETAMAEWETASEAVWIERYGPLIDDVRGALDWAAGAEPDAAVALAGASWRLWGELSLRVEGQQRLSAAAERMHSGTPPELEARLRRGLGEFLGNIAVTKAAHDEFDRAAFIYRQMGDLPRLGSVLTRLAYTSLMLDRLEDAQRFIREALELLDAASCPRTLATAYATQLCIESYLGRSAAAQAAGEKATRLCNLVGADRTALRMACNLVEIRLNDGDVDGAISAGRSLARRLCGPSHSQFRGFVLGVLTGALTRRGDLDQALETAREAAPLLRDEGCLFQLFDDLALRGALAGRCADAALLGGYADSVFRRIDQPREPRGRRSVALLGERLGGTLPDPERARLRALGGRLTEDQALALALSL